MLVPFARVRSRAEADAAALAGSREAELQADLTEHGAVVVALTEQVAALTEQLAAERRASRRERRRLRRRLARSRSRLAVVESSWSWRATAPLRRFRRRP